MYRTMWYVGLNAVNGTADEGHKMDEFKRGDAVEFKHNGEPLTVIQGQWLTHPDGRRERWLVVRSETGSFTTHPSHLRYASAVLA